MAWLSRYKERYFKRRLRICTSSAEPPVSQPDLEGILFVEIPDPFEGILLWSKVNVTAAVHCTVYNTARVLVPAYLFNHLLFARP